MTVGWRVLAVDHTGKLVVLAEYDSLHNAEILRDVLLEHRDFPNVFIDPCWTFEASPDVAETLLSAVELPAVA